MATLLVTILVFWALSSLSTVHELPPRKGRRRMRTAARIIGAWQLTTAAAMVLLPGDTTWSGVVTLAIMGATFLVVPWFWMPALYDIPGEDPDWEDRSDVERWLAENEPGQHRR